MNRHARLVRGVCIWGLGVGLIGMVMERILSVGWDYRVFGPHGGRPFLEFDGDPGTSIRSWRPSRR